VAAEHDLADEPLPIAQLGKASSIVRRVLETGRARILTENGAEVDAGDEVDDEVVRADLRARFAGRVPPELMAELDRE
jgi:hypothetical protein